MGRRCERQSQVTLGEIFAAEEERKCRYYIFLSQINSTLDRHAFNPPFQELFRHVTHRHPFYALVLVDVLDNPAITYQLYSVWFAEEEEEGV